jgi:GNAT superfamily N-acetyltransferase
LGHDARVQITTPDPATYSALLDLEVERLPRTERAASAGLFETSQLWDYRHFRTALVDGDLAGWGFTARPTFFPPDWAILHVIVAAAHEGQGVGTALRAELTALLPDSARVLASRVDDLEERSLAVAQHWGYRVEQHGIISELALVDLPQPVLPPGVTVEDAATLTFPDEEAVDAMLVDSQTNPEAVQDGIISRLSDTRVELAAADRPFAVLARVDGIPAAIITGEVKDEILLIHYTGVGQAFRGRGLAFLLKQEAHLRAAAAGATRSYTTNEATNAGIRHVNAKLGYRIVTGDYRIRRSR